MRKGNCGMRIEKGNPQNSNSAITEPILFMLVGQAPLSSRLFSDWFFSSKPGGKFKYVIDRNHLPSLF